MTSANASYQFPPDFMWGVASAAYQIEGGVKEGGRGDSTWDVFCRGKGNIRTGESGDIACDHFHRYRDDVKLMASLGVKHYRFSIAWSRVIPDGNGAVNDEGVDFYSRLIDCLGEHGITPHATLFHWDSPQALQEQYNGFCSPRWATDFARYAGLMAKRLGDRVSSWLTINEIACFTQWGHYYGNSPQGLNAPGMKVADQRAIHQTVVHTMLGHGLAVQALRANSAQPCKVGFVHNEGMSVPISETPANIHAARKRFSECCNVLAFHPLMTGALPEWWVKQATANGTMPQVSAAELKIMGEPIDWLGHNVYTGTYVRAADNAQGYEDVPVPAGYPASTINWLILNPDALYWQVRFATEVFNFTKPHLITENGYPGTDEFTATGEIMDLERIWFMRSYLRQVHRLIEEGFPVLGYFYWTMLDNFEWLYGYSKRFGMIHVNFETQERTPKASAHWYAETIRQNRLV